MMYCLSKAKLESWRGVVSQSWEQCTRIEGEDQKSPSLYFETRTYSFSLGNMTTAEEIEMRISSVFPLGFSNYRFRPADEEE